jgi:hypothetical protein
MDAKVSLALREIRRGAIRRAAAGPDAIVRSGNVAVTY